MINLLCAHNDHWDYGFIFLNNPTRCPQCGRVIRLVESWRRNFLYEPVRVYRLTTYPVGALVPTPLPIAVRLSNPRISAPSEKKAA